MNNVKPGYATSEFWLHAATVLLALLVSAGLLTSSQSDALAKAVADASAALVSAGAAWATVRYTQARSAVKEAAAAGPTSPAP